MNRIPTTRVILIGFMLTVTVMSLVAIPQSSAVGALSFGIAVSTIGWLPVVVACAWAKREIHAHSKDINRRSRYANRANRLWDVAVFSFGFLMASATRLWPMDYAAVIVVAFGLAGYGALIGFMASRCVAQVMQDGAKEV